MPISGSAPSGDRASEVMESSAFVSSSDEEDEPYTSADEEVHWSYSVNSLNAFNMHPKDGDYSQFKKQLECDLRVGSAYHIGTRKKPFRFSSKPYLVTDCVTRRVSTATCPVKSAAFTRHPFNLILAREQGDIGPASKSRRLCYRASRWTVEGSPRFDGLQTFGNRSIGVVNTDPQTFQDCVQGSIWAVSRLHLENKFRCHRGCVNALSFNGPGNLVASGSDDLKVVVTNWITKEQVSNYNTGHCMNIFHVKFIPETNDTQIVSCACDSEVRLAQLASDGSLTAPTRLLVSHNRACHKLALPQGEPHVVLSAGADGQVFSIDLRESKAHSILRLPSSEFFSIASNPVEPQEIAVCGRSEAVIRVYDRRKMNSNDPRSGYVCGYGAQHLRPSNRTTTTPASTAQTNTLERGSVEEDDDLEHTRAPSNLEDHEAEDDEEEEEVEQAGSDFFSSLSAQLGRRVRAVLSGLRGRTRIALRVQGNTSDPVNLSYGFEKSKFSATAAVYSNQGDAILASYNDEDIYLFDTKNPSAPYLHKYSGHRNMQTIVGATFFGPNSEYVVSGSDDGFFYIWDRESEGIVQWLHADAEGAVNVIESHPTLPVLASAGLDYDFKVWTPLRPLNEYDDLSHLKYTFSKVPPDILRLRRSRLARALYAETASVPTTRPDNNNNTRVVLEQTELMPDEPTRDSENPENVSQMSDPVPVTDRLHVNGSTGTSNVTNPDDATARSCSSATQAVRKRRRCHSSAGDVQNDSASMDSDVEMPVQVHSDGEQSARSDSPRATHSRHARKHRRCRRLSSPTDRQPSGPADPPMDSDTAKQKPSLTDVTESNSSPNCIQPRLPQYLLPFNRRDLELRVAQNWVNRTCELSQMDGLDEADSRILSALESVAQLHAHESRHGINSPNSDDSDDTDNSTDDSGIMGSFLLIRRPNCPIERSEETLATRDRAEQSSSSSSSDTSSLSDLDSSSGTSCTTNNAELSHPDEDSNDTDHTASSSSSSTSSTSTAVASTSTSSSPTLSSAASNDSEILQLLNLNAATSLTFGDTNTTTTTTAVSTNTVTTIRTKVSSASRSSESNLNPSKPD